MHSQQKAEVGFARDPFAVLPATEGVVGLAFNPVLFAFGSTYEMTGPLEGAGLLGGQPVYHNEVSWLVAAHVQDVARKFIQRILTRLHVHIPRSHVRYAVREILLGDHDGRARAGLGEVGRTGLAVPAQ